MWMPDPPVPSSSSLAPNPKASKKRKHDSNNEQENIKRVKLATKSNPSTPSGAKPGVRLTTSIPFPPDAAPTETHNPNPQIVGKEETKPATDDSEDIARPKYRRRKLVPPRPFPIVPTSVSATGPRSAHTEGKNIICVTRKTKLAAYIRRCKDVVFKDGYKTLILTAIGAAIPHLMQLVAALPPILSWPPEDIHTEVTTGTVEVQDEIIPEDEEQDITYEIRGKSSLKIIMKLGDGKQERPSKRSGKKAHQGRQHRQAAKTAPTVIPEPEHDMDVILEPEQMMDMI